MVSLVYQAFWMMLGIPKTALQSLGNSGQDVISCFWEEYFTISFSKPTLMTSIELIKSHGFRSLTTTKMTIIIIKDGHKKAESPQGMYSLVPSLSKVDAAQMLSIHNLDFCGKRGIRFTLLQSLSLWHHYCVDCYKSNEYFRLLPYYD